jgi:hypothetical protein
MGIARAVANEVHDFRISIILLPSLIGAGVVSVICLLVEVNARMVCYDITLQMTNKVVLVVYRVSREAGGSTLPAAVTLSPCGNPQGWRQSVGAIVCRSQTHEDGNKNECHSDHKAPFVQLPKLIDERLPASAVYYALNAVCDFNPYPRQPTHTQLDYRPQRFLGAQERKPPKARSAGT